MALRFLTSRHARALLGACLVAPLLGTGLPFGQAAQSVIPDELAVIAAACRENLASIKSLQLAGTLTLTGAQYAGQWDPLADQTYNSQTREFCIWKDAVNFRFDVTADREVDWATGEVQYNLPYGEHITSYRRLDLDALKRQYGTPQSTRRTIVTPDRVYQYRPEANQLELNNLFTATALKEQPEPEMQLALNRTFMGFTVAEFVDKWTELAVRGDRSVEVASLGDGKYRVRTNVEGTPTHACTSEAIIDLDRGANVISYVGQIDGQIVRTGQFDYMNVGGAWVVVHAEVTELVGPNGTSVAKAVYDVRPESIWINETIDPQVFTFEGLAVRRGALVFDAETREEYLYDDVPLHLKVALAMEREREEELAEAAAQAAATPPPPPADGPARKPPPEESSKAPMPTRANDSVRTPQRVTPFSPPVAPPTEPAARPSDGPAGTVVEAPTTPAATRPASALDRTSVSTRLPTTQPAHQAPTAPLQEPTAEPVGVTGRWAPRGTVTAAAVSAGVAVALAVVLWRLMHRAVR